MKDLTIHPLCALYPDLPEDELQALADDIRQNGQMMPILRWGKVVLDGKNRLKACGIAGVQPNFEDWYPTDPKDEARSHEEATSAARSLNFHRRHLTPSQKSLVAAGETANLQSVTVAQAAAEMQVSERSVSSARKVLQNGSESLKDAVRNGEVTVSDAASVVDLPKSEQTAAVSAVRNGKSPTVRKAAEREPGDETEHKRPRTKDGKSSVPKSLQQVAESVKEFRSAINATGRLREQIREICESPGGVKAARVWSDMQRMLEQISVNLKTLQFWSACPECKITDKHSKPEANCKLCRGHGWIAKTNGLSIEHKEWMKEHGVDV